MTFWRQRILILCALLWGGGQLFAAPTREERTFAAAQAAFQDEMWGRAEMEFAEFIEKYPESASVPQAVLQQAQAQFKQGDFTNAIALLDAHKAQAKTLADQYVNWIGEAQFAGSNFLAAAETFTTLANDFTNSTMRLSATVNAAAARAQLAQWPQVETLLEAPNGVFQKTLQLDQSSEWILHGQLLRAQAKFARQNFSGALAILTSKKLDALPGELGWPWAYLLCQSQQVTHDLTGALTTTTNLYQLAAFERNNVQAAASVSVRAGLLEQLQLTNDAIAVYQENLTTNAPVENQQRAVLKIAELSVAQNQFTNAIALLDTFQINFPDSPAAAVALISVGEMHLKNFSAQPALTNELLLAKACLDQFLAVYTNSQSLGQAYLDRGWCNWLAQNFAASAADFKMAVAYLPRSADSAVAHFKLGDALFALNDFTNALENYRLVVDGFPDFPVVVQTLDERALYQSLRVSLALNDYPDAANAVTRILKNYPEGDLSDNAVLLLGEYVSDSGRAPAARKLFEQFAQQYTNSDLRPQAELAVARSYGQEGNWPAAITNYEGWLKKFPTHDLLPQAFFATALANYQAGNETNALAQFNLFVTKFPTNALAPQAQWWTAEYFFRHGDFGGAETNYENVWQNPAWRNSQLYYSSQLMAGLAAYGRNGYSDAAGYFNKLISDTNCPVDLGVRARFACAAAYEQMPSSDTNNPLGNFSTAITYLNQVVQINPTNDAAARAWGEIGKCHFQLNDFDAAMNAYAQVVSSPAADISARSEAQIGAGLVLEKMSQLPGADATNLLQQALNKYLDVLDAVNLREGEHADPFWMKKAGLQVVSLLGTVNERSLTLPDLNVNTVSNLCQRLEILLPQLKDLIEKARLAALTRWPTVKN